MCPRTLSKLCLQTILDIQALVHALVDEDKRRQANGGKKAEKEKFGHGHSGPVRSLFKTRKSDEICAV